MGKNKFSSRLKIIREQAGLTQKELAANLGITYTKYNHYETGRNQPDIETIIQISEFFGVSIDYLLGRDELQLKEKSLSPEKERLINEIMKDNDNEVKEMEAIRNFVKSKKEKNEDAATTA